MSKYSIFIDGKPQSGGEGKYEAVINPATEEVIAEVPVCNEEDVGRAVSAAVKAFESWGETTPAERSQALYKLADAVESHTEELGLLESLNVGKPLAYAQGEVGTFVDNLRFFAGAARTLSGVAAGEYAKGHTSMIRRDPVGIVGSIAPWNYPLMMAGWKIGPALAAGNTVVFKPSELTPLTTLKLAEIAQDIFPPGVFNVLTGHGEPVGSTIVKHPQINMVSLTGSVRAGQSVARDASSTLKRVHLELGGKAPFIIFDDADVDAAIEVLRLAAFYNSGQDCTAATRIYVAEKIYDKVVDKLVSAVKSLKVGDPMDAKTEMGPLVSRAHLDRVSAFVERASGRSNIEVLTGGAKMAGKGFYFQPTVIAGTEQSDELVQQEIFGPVITVMPFKNDDEAFALANDCMYGLAASVWTTNVQRAMKAAKCVKFGTVWINNHFLLISEMPHGGSKMSGYGKDQSIFSIEEYTEIRHTMFNFS